MIKKEALYIRTLPEDKLEGAIGFCDFHNLNLTIINRMNDMPVNTIPHDQFLQLLKCFDYFLDLKGLTNRTVLSRSGLEALKAGCRVIVDTGEIITRFRRTKAREYLKLYKSLLKEED